MSNATIIEGETVPVSQLNLRNVLQIPAVRQVMILLGVAAAVAAGFSIVLWSQAPGYVNLYSQLDTDDAAQVVDALRSADIEHKLDPASGTVMVPEARLHAARLELASQGLPRGAATGIESLREQPAFGQSQFRETALYQHALESELAETIGYIGAVRDARVHLAVPRQSAFIRDRKKASASVMLNLHRGRELEPDQATSIVNLVASSVPNLLAADITVIDQHGRLLSSGEQEWSERVTASQFKFAERVERNYKRRIEDLLTPLVGPGRVRAEVVADLDFTISEETRESFDPDSTAVISESVTENQTTNAEPSAGGIPGALSNQPPEAGGTEAAPQAGAESSRSASSSTRNYEVDRTISHTRPQPGTIRKLSVAVLVDDSPVETADGSPGNALSDEQIARYTTLIKEAVGFDEARGDTVAVVGAAFQPVPELPVGEPPKFWENPVVTDTLRQVLGVALVLALGFGLVRPLLKSLLATDAPSGRQLAAGTGAGTAGNVQFHQGNAALTGPSYDEKIAAAKNISAHDPAKVAQVVKQWVNTDAD